MADFESLVADPRSLRCAQPSRDLLQPLPVCHRRQTPDSAVGEAQVPESAALIFSKRVTRVRTMTPVAPRGVNP
jgi:hypothetical protein